MPPPALATLNVWCEYILSLPPVSWKTMLGKAAARSAAGSDAGNLADINTSVDVDDDDLPLADVFLRERFVCELCNLDHDSEQQLNSHKAAKHGWRNPIRALVVGSVCPSCMKDHHTRPRLIHHLSRSNWCCETMRRWRAPLPPEEVLAADMADRADAKRLKLLGRPPLWAELPAYRRKGPRPLRFDRAEARLQVL